MEQEPNATKFDLGEVVVTPQAAAYLAEQGLTADTFLRLHAAGRWNEVFESDNNLSLSRSERLFLRAWYHTPLGKHLWIVTDSARTVVMLPSVCEYCGNDLLWPTLDQSICFCSEDCFKDRIRSSEDLGFLYFFEAIGADRIAIGWARDVELTLAEVRAAIPCQVEALKELVGTRFDERELHLRFAPLNINPDGTPEAPRDWFHAAPELRAYINGISVARPWE